MTNPEFLPAVRSNPRVARARGFTLIELMIVLGVIAVLATIAITSYDFAVTKSRRATARGCVEEGAQFMERYYTTNMTYTGAALPACSSDVTTYYTVGFSGTPDATTYTVQATPKGMQASHDTACAILGLNQAGVKTTSGTGSLQECW